MNHFSTLAKTDHRYLWHPFTQQQEWCQEEPLMIVSGQGPYLFDINGHRYLDGNSSIWTNIHGHCHPHIVKAISEQAAQLDHSSFLGATHPKAIELAERLIAFFPHKTLSRVFYSDNGSTAVEVALKMTLQYWQLVNSPHRNRFVSFSNCYHGDTTGASSLNNIPLCSDPFNNIHFKVENVANISHLEALPNPESIAAIIIEPLIQGVAGMRLWPKGTLQALRNYCDRTGALLIFDEVMTGFGRTGSMFACLQENIFPDFLTIAKGLTGGTLPLGATLVTEKIYEAFLGSFGENKRFCYGHSYTANPIGCAAALASLDIFEQESVLEKLPSKIRHLTEGLKKLEKISHVGEIRQCGLIAGIDIMLDSKSHIPYLWEEQIGAQVCKNAWKYGLLTRPLRYTNRGDMIVFMPPLCVTHEQLDEAIDALSRAIQEVTD